MKKYSSGDLKRFLRIYDPDHEARALTARREFLRKFPIRSLTGMDIEDYVIGTGKPTFCALVEAKTRAWANMQGASAFKFGIYYGKTRSDSRMRYRAVEGKFPGSPDTAFQAVKAALIQLIRDGRRLRFEEIDANPLSQMFKAKILGLYFPELYINVCSRDAIRDIERALGLTPSAWVSEAQHRIAQEKAKDPIACEWTNPAYMAFLYAHFMGQPPVEAKTRVRKPKTKVHRAVDFDELALRRKEIGKKSEAFALKWERSRLIDAGLYKRGCRVEDRTDKPSYGYDFRSYSSVGEERYIEVKTVRQERGDLCGFFLSENELSTSQMKANVDRYFFYLVFRDSSGEPSHLHVIRAADLYAGAESMPTTYYIRFELEGVRD